MAAFFFDAPPDRDPLRKPHYAMRLARLRRQGELIKKSILMAVDTLQLITTDVRALRADVDELQIVVHGDETKDVTGLRKRVSAVEQLAEELAQARKLDQERWKWLSKGLLIGLSITSLGSVIAALPQLLALLHGVVP